MSPQSTVNYTGRKLGFQPAPKAPLAMHIQAPGTNKPSPVSPSGIESIASPTVDSTVKHAGSARFVGGLRVHPPAPESTTKPPTVTPSGIDSNPSPTVDPTANRAGLPVLVAGRPCILQL